MKDGREKDGVERWSRDVAFWLRFDRESVYNTKAVCKNNEFVNCQMTLLLREISVTVQ